jgi:hypothetical protein
MRGSSGVETTRENCSFAAIKIGSTQLPCLVRFVNLPICLRSQRPAQLRLSLIRFTGVAFCGETAADVTFCGEVAVIGTSQARAGAAEHAVV